MFDSFLSAVARGESGFDWLELLWQLDRELCTKAASHYFALALADNSQSFARDVFAAFVTSACELDNELLPLLVERTESLDRAAGERLCSLILEAIDQPECVDAIGFLAAAELRELLET